MSFLRLLNVSLSFGAEPIFDEIDLNFNKNERSCLIGRNGTGKSTLLKLIAGDIVADSGILEKNESLKISTMPQHTPLFSGTIFDVVLSGLGKIGQLLSDYHHLTTHMNATPDMLSKLEKIQHDIEAKNGWSIKNKIDAMISRLQLSADENFDQLSGGSKRRVLLARALVIEPDLLILDEPTNHLDITTIEWMENFLLSLDVSLLFVTHDRNIINRLANKIIELDRGKIYSFPGNYEAFLKQKQAQLENEAIHNKKFDAKLAKEEIWIRQGIKARRTRNEGRVRALIKLREEQNNRRERKGNVLLPSIKTEKSAKIVIEATAISFNYPDKSIIDAFSCVIQRGDKIGIIGNNGCGKTTLLQLLLQKKTPLQGTVKLGENITPVYFDQHRDQLDDNKTLIENISSSQMVEIDGKQKHIISYLQDFLFPPKQLNNPVHTLSGGEKNRLLLAKLFCQPANLLVMDEPTNDLDIETLELLEEKLTHYPGTLFLVSHDRQLINNVVTSTIVFEENNVRQYIGGYDDWLRQRAPTKSHTAQKQNKTVKNKPKKSISAKLSYKEQQELKQLPEKIEQLEDEQQQVLNSMAASGFYAQAHDKIKAIQDNLHTIEQQLETCYERWSILEE